MIKYTCYMKLQNNKLFKNAKAFLLWVAFNLQYANNKLRYNLLKMLF